MTAVCAIAATAPVFSIFLKCISIFCPRGHCALRLATLRPKVAIPNCVRRCRCTAAWPSCPASAREIPSATAAATPPNWPLDTAVISIGYAGRAVPRAFLAAGACGSTGVLRRSSEKSGTGPVRRGRDRHPLRAGRRCRGVLAPTTLPRRWPIGSAPSTMNCSARSRTASRDVIYNLCPAESFEREPFFQKGSLSSSPSKNF